MKLAAKMKVFIPAALITVLIATHLAPSAISAQRRSTTAKQVKPQTPFAQGYGRGYNDGFAQGGLDWSNSAPRDFRGSDKWQQRDTNMTAEVRQGYELGFELGYSDGYFGRARNAAVPHNAEVLARAAAISDQQRARRVETDRPQPDREPQDVSTRRQSGRLSIPNGTELRIRLSSPISTQTGRVGDTFRATVVSPSTYESSTVEGHIATLNKSGRVSGKTEVGLAFDTLTTPDGRQARIDADLVKVYESENVKKVDEEGHVESGSRTKDSEVRGGIGAAAGAIIGGIIGGGKGAIIGLILGGAAGVGSVYVEGNKDLVMDPGTEMVIRTVSKDR